MFEVFSSSEKDACTSLNQVMKRIQEYFSHHREVRHTSEVGTIPGVLFLFSGVIT
jgi:hypothetical protein